MLLWTAPVLCPLQSLDVDKKHTLYYTFKSLKHLKDILKPIWYNQEVDDGLLVELQWLWK